MSCERLTKWLPGHYLLNAFKTPVAIILKILSLLIVVLLFLDDKTILMLGQKLHFSNDAFQSYYHLFQVN